MQTTGGHFLRPSFSLLTHQDKGPCTLNGGIELRAVCLGVKVSVGHEIFAANLTRFDNRGAPKQSPFRRFRDRRPPLDSVNKKLRIHFLRGILIKKKGLNVAKGLSTVTNSRPFESAR